MDCWHNLAKAALIISTALVASCGGGNSDSPSPSSESPSTTAPPSPGASNTAPSMTRVTSDSGYSSLTYFSLELAANDVIWDAVNRRLHVAVSASSPMSPSTIVSIDPVNGQTLAVVPVAPEPAVLAVSSDGQFLYAGLTRGGGMKRFVAATLTEDFSVPIGVSDPANFRFSEIRALAVSPTNPRTVAVVATNLYAVLVGAGVVIYDDTTVRPNTLNGFATLPTGFMEFNVVDVAWTSDGSAIYAANGSWLNLAVDAQGVSLARVDWWNIGTSFRLDNSQVYVDDGRVFDLPSLMQVGRFADYGNRSLARAEMMPNGKVFSARNHTTQLVVDGITFTSFNPNTFAAIDTIQLPGFKELATYAKLRSWGTSGLVWTNSSQLVVASGTFVESGGIPPSPSSAQVFVEGTVAASDGTALGYKMIAIGATDVAGEGCADNLFVSTSGSSVIRPNAIVAVNRTTGSIATSTYVGSEPTELAMSDDCSTLYAGLLFSNSVKRINAVDLSIELAIRLQRDIGYELGDYTFGDIVFARAIAVMPGSPKTFAITKGIVGQFCTDVDLGVAIIDDATERPVTYFKEPNTNLLGTVTNIVWSNTSDVAYAEDREGLWSFFVDPAGIHRGNRLRPFVVGTHVPDLGRALRFDPVKNRLYDSFRNVYDIGSDMIVGPIGDPWTAGLVGNCGTPDSALTISRTTGKIFVVHESFSPTGFDIYTFDSDTLASVASAHINLNGKLTFAGEPLRIVKSGATQIAFVTSSGHLVLLDGHILSD